MQETINFTAVATTVTTTKNALSAFSKPNVPPKSPNFPSLSSPKFPKFRTLSSRTSTIPRPPRPTKQLPIPSNAELPPPPPPHHRQHHQLEFQEKMLFLDSIGIDSFSLLNDHPFTITTSNLHDLKSLIEFLTSFAFSAAELRRIVNMCPEILSLRLNDIVPVFTFLLREAKVTGSDLRRVINRRPRLLASNVETRLRPTLYFLQSIGIHEVCKHTYLLSSSVEEKFIPKIDYFQKIGFSYRDSISMFRRFPPLFCYSVQTNFEPKFNYFVVEMGRELKELKEFPQYFSFSLERRIKPRHQNCVENGVCFPLPALLKTTEKEFRDRLDVCCSSSIPFSNSPLWCQNYCDVNSM
ncbi:hypothetical protein Nepgr_011827 [Nepenthes gracilis]|uniref:Uncharacterized protein n=1 Tax=Nepenthes gracilis TaxID=150966 RepID=A0AAD3SGD6_NEPGR|nr:hypothetical protein Nepgr_011827 [Nepenthes gracilis]